jgi:hypothetical protein
MARKGDWGQIHLVVLQPEQRTASIPEDTKAVPFEMWVKGHLTTDAEIGQEVTVVTRTGRHVRGHLVEVNPRYTHSFGDFVPEILTIGDTVRQLVFGGQADAR